MYVSVFAEKKEEKDRKMTNYVLTVVQAVRHCVLGLLRLGYRPLSSSY